MQDTLFERSAQLDARALAKNTNFGETNTIEESIAETLSELDAGDSGGFDLGATPLDKPDMTRQVLPAKRSTASRAGRRHRRRHGPADNSASRILLAVMLLSALLALAMLGVAYTEGFIP